MESGAYPSQNGSYSNRGALSQAGPNGASQVGFSQAGYPQAGYPVGGSPYPVGGQGKDVAAVEESGSVDFWGILRRRFFLIGFILLSVIALGVLYLFNATPIFESTARIQIIPEKPLSVNLGQNQIGTGRFRDPLAASHANSMLGTSVLGNVLIGESKMIASPTFSEVVNPAQPNQIDQNVIDYIGDNLDIVQDADDEYMFILSFRSKYKEDSGRFLNDMIRVYQENLTTGYQNDIKSAMKRLEEVVGSFSDNLRRVEKEIFEFRRDNPIPKLDSNGSTMARKMVDARFPEFQKAMAELEETRHVLEQVSVFQEQGHPAGYILEIALQEQMEQNNTGDAIVMRDMIEKPRAELMGLMVSRDSLLRSYGEKHPRVIEVNQMIVSLEEIIRKRLEESQDAFDIPAEQRLSLILDKLNRDLATQTEKVSSLGTELATNQADAEKFQRLLEVEQELKDKRERIYTMMDSAQNSFEELKVASTDDGYKFIILNQAIEGVQVEPSPLIVFGLSTILGSLLGFGIGYLVDVADKTFRTPHEIIRTLNLALIGHIPVIRVGKLKDEKSAIHPVICTFHKPKAQTSEAFRAVRTAIYFSTQGQRHQVIQVTSPTPGDGKTTLASNLAITIAQSGKRVLLVDADMRRPSIHKLFKLDETPGFSDVLVEESTLEEVIRQSEVDGLDILPCGNKPIQPSELLTSHRLPEVIDDLRQMYDYVIMDSPPVLVVTDPCPVAAVVDGVICAMRIKKNVRVSAERMVEILRSVNANIIGIVVNGVGAQGTYSSQYSYGAYQSGYSNYGGYGYGGYNYGRYGQSEKVYDDGRRPQLALPKRRLAEKVSGTTEE